MVLKQNSKRVLMVFIVLFIILTISAPVLAVPNDKVAKLIMTGGTGLSQMKDAVAAQVGHEGDVLQHDWVGFGSNPFGDVAGYISNDDKQASKQAVVVWFGEDYLSSKIPGYDSWFGNDWLNRDGSHLHSSDAEYSATAIGRALAGYDYYVLEERVTAGSAEDSIPVDQVAKKYSDKEQAQAYKPVENWHWESTSGKEKPNEDDPNIRNIEAHYKDVDGEQVLDHYSWEYHHTDNWTYWVEVKQHKRGYAEDWKEKKAMVYLVSLAPYSKSTDLDLRDQQNQNTVTFNSTLKSTATGITFIDIFEKMLNDNPYYRDGLDHGLYYDDPTLTTIFHLIWNTILLDNPIEEPPKPLDFSLYPLSSSLTSYMNKVISPSADEKYSSHTLPETATGIVGNAGAFLGYGDKDYGFTEYITTRLSATSSLISYKSLLNHSGNDYTDMHLYARYGYLLKDLGLDKTGSVTTGGLTRLIPGGLIYFVFILSSSVSITFGLAFKVLKWLNPFQFLTHASAISDEWKERMVAEGGLNFPGGEGVEKVITGFMDFVGEIYDAFYNMGVWVVLPLTLVLLVAGVLMFNRRRKSGVYWSKLKRYVVTFVFIVLGIPLIGNLYTVVLEYVSDITVKSNSLSNQVVASTFVDFEGWAKKFRLSPLENIPNGLGEVSTTLESDVADGGMNKASDKSYKNLRKTVIAINKAVGSIDDIDVSMYQNSDSEQDWVMNSLPSTIISTGSSDGLLDTKGIEQASSLIKSYMSGDFYQPSDWESDSMSVFSKNHKNINGKDEIGQLTTEQDGNTATLYELFDKTNELNDWIDREPKDNVAIFKGFAPYDTWGNFNVFNNGGLKASNPKATPEDFVKYTTDKHITEHGPLCLCSKLGLSTISMYNYLSTDFQDSDMVVYSNVDSHSKVTKEAHYSVNIIGSGVLGFLYGLNCFAILACTSILGICYALGMMVNTFKRTFFMLGSIPFSLLGAMRSIIRVIIGVVTMICEIIGTVLAFALIMNVISVIISVLEQPLSGMLSTGILASANSFDVNLGLIGVILGLVFSIILMFIISICAIKYCAKFHRCYNKIAEYVWCKYLGFIKIERRETMRVMSILKADFI